MKRSILHTNFRVSEGLDGECGEEEVYDGVLVMKSTPRRYYVALDGVEGTMETRTMIVSC